MKPAYYNEIDPYAAQHLRNLIASGLIAPGDVDERSIEDVAPDDLTGYGQCHFFAGVGVWSYALRRAGVPDGYPVWTGSCPCQPFSAAGKGAGFADERHLWPAFFHLIRERRPVSVLGEQVASHDGLNWLDLVQDDMEGADYAFWAVETCAAGFGAPHIRQRLYWVGHAIGARLEGHAGHGDDASGWALPAGSTAEAGDAGGLADAGGAGQLPGALAGVHRRQEGAGARHGESERHGATGGLADTELQQRPSRETGVGIEHDATGRIEGAAAITGLRGDLRTCPTNGFWRDADWLYCRDGRWRPVGPGASPLVDGAPARMGRLRAYGNAINAAQAEGFIRAVMG